MQPGCHNTTSLNLRVATEYHIGMRVDHHARLDTRRFGTVFPLEVPDTISVDSTKEEHNDSDDLSRFEFVAALHRDTPTQVTSRVSVDENSTLSAAQQVIACYHVIRGSDYAPGHDSAEAEEKQHLQIPDDQRSMYTLATTTETRSTMDMMWRPKPKVHMRRADQRALMQAQTQAIAMMHNAGLKPTDKIQCRRRGCADILPDVEALKYHLHIHNIADSVDKRRDGPPSVVRKPPPVEYSISNSETPKRKHSRSKSSLGIHHKHSTSSPPPRKLSTGSLLPSLFSRESSPEVAQAPSFTTVARAFTPNPSPSRLAVPSPTRNIETTSSPTSVLPRGRRQRKQSVAISVGAPCSPGIAMLLSPPSSPTMPGTQNAATAVHLGMNASTPGRLVLVPRVNLPQLVSPRPTKDTEIENMITYPVLEQHMRSRSPVRTLSPTRAMSPIRNGIKRILSIGSPDNVHDK